MKVQIFKDAGYGGGKLCWVQVTKTEALALIQSLAEQLKTGNPNSGRLESRCRGDVSELSICVHERD
ncbi:MAG: hypothetical protein WC315_00685 [Candidatus Omnitrophota bacterium]|jgi:hypothetical protein